MRKVKACSSGGDQSAHLCSRFLCFVIIRDFVIFYSWYSFLLEAESNPSAIVRLEGLGKWKTNAPHRDLNPRYSGLKHSAYQTARY
jgi:hypothetical protein